MGATMWLKKIRNNYLRIIKYRRYNIGKGFYAGARVRIWGKNKIVIGKNFYIGRDSFIEADVVIGDNVIWANRVALVGKYDHHYQQPGVPTRLAMQIRDAGYNWKGLNMLTIIEDDVWVGYNCTILSGVTIKEGSVIAAGSLVTKDVEPYSIYAGAPAKKVGNRFENTEDLKQHLSLVQSKYIEQLSL
jgi:chloramphenicol O-acetyltransferase type B